VFSTLRKQRKKGQNSGVLYIKEAAKKGYKEAHEGDSIDLGCAAAESSG
jgi:hypothetical protein